MAVLTFAACVADPDAIENDELADADEERCFRGYSEWLTSSFAPTIAAHGDTDDSLTAALSALKGPPACTTPAVYSSWIKLFGEVVGKPHQEAYSRARTKLAADGDINSFYQAIQPSARTLRPPVPSKA